MAAAQALVIGSLGALAGIVVGFVPGAALVWPLTGVTVDPISGAESCGSPTLAIPWLALLGIGLVIPALAALTAALVVRSRLQ